MFTGLVEAVGTVSDLVEKGEQARLTVRLPFASELSLGDSVAINGCCLTVTQVSICEASFDVLAQTLKVTSLGQLETGRQVNLERALCVGDRLGGHFVQGHVDATGEILDWSKHGQDHRLEVSLPPEVHSLCIPKGSLAIDGISLPLAELTENSAVCWITPHTALATHLETAQISQKVNLESDLLAKYVRQQLPDLPSTQTKK